MQAWWTLLRRELGIHFFSWTGYVVVGIVVFLLGLSFVGLLEALNTEPITTSITELFFETNYFWLILLLVSPLITMRTFAREKTAGTFETLMTAPVSDTQVVLAKFFGAALFYLLMWLPLIGCTLVLRHYAQETAALDPGKLATSFLGVMLIGFLYLALGCFASALSSSQVSAAMGSYAVGISLFMVSFLSYAMPPQSGWLAVCLGHANSIEHMKDFARGMVDSRAVVFYLTLTGFFIHLTLKAVESRRWK
jgi:ABC-2 type transport system permease protein